MYGLKDTEEGRVSYDVWKNTTHPEDFKEVEKALQDGVEGTKEYDTTFRIVLPTRAIHYIRAFGVVMKNEKGQPVNMIGVNFDITKEKEVDKAKTEFVSLASHQLRTPLSSINWYSEMLLSGDAGELNKDQKEFINEIYTGNQRMVSLVNALLNVSRLELGTFAVDPTELDIKKEAHTIVEEIKLIASKKEIEISTNYQEELPTVMTDKNLLGIVITNLLSNAVKYTPDKGSVKLDVTHDDKWISIKVSDTGIGIPEEQQENIFSKLFRADNAKQSDSEGTGLGLYIIKSIADHAGGEISFESKKDKGSTFEFKLPLSGMKSRNGSKKLED
jgi:signal transduction histidine kinase